MDEMLFCQSCGMPITSEEGLIRQGHVWKGRGVVDLLLFSRLKSDVVGR